MSASAASTLMRLVVRPIRRQRVEVVDDAENAGAKRDLVLLEPDG